MSNIKSSGKSGKPLPLKSTVINTNEKDDESKHDISLDSNDMGFSMISSPKSSFDVDPVPKPKLTRSLEEDMENFEASKKLKGMVDNYI